MRNFGKDFKDLCSRFKEYLLNFGYFLIMFSVWVIFSAFIVLSIHLGLDFLGVSHRIINTIQRVILSITPFFVIMFFWRDRNSNTVEDVEGAVMDCCFTAWIILLLILWI